MTLPLDTRTVVWLTEDHAALAKNEIANSSITFYELGLQLHKRRIGGPPDLGGWRQRITGLALLEFPVSTEIAMRESGLDNMTGDPVDRLIVATALVADAVLLTADQSILEWSGRLHRQDAQR